MPWPSNNQTRGTMIKSRAFIYSLSLSALLALPMNFSAQTQTMKLSADQQLAHEIFQQLIEINTTDSIGDCSAAAKAMAERLKSAGLPRSDGKVPGPHHRQ